MFRRNTQYSVCRLCAAGAHPRIIGLFVLENKPKLFEVLRNTSFALKATLQYLQTP